NPRSAIEARQSEPVLRLAGPSTAGVGGLRPWRSATQKRQVGEEMTGMKRKLWRAPNVLYASRYNRSFNGEDHTGDPGSVALLGDADKSGGGPHAAGDAAPIDCFRRPCLCRKTSA